MKSLLDRSWAAPLIFGLAVLFVLLCYLPGLAEPYFQVDDFVLTSAPMVRAAWSWRALISIFTPGHQIDFYPIRDLSHWLDWSFGVNIEENGTIARLQNLLWLAGTGMALAWLWRSWGVARNLSWIAAAFWISWPTHAETWMWIAGRKDVMAMFFAVASLVAFSCGRQGRRGADLVALVFFVLSLFSKASFLLLPVGLAAWMWLWPKRRTQRDWIFLGLWFAVAIGAGLLHLWIYRSVNDMALNYPPSYRWPAVISALGRMMVGLFWMPANTVDVENWGEWMSLNREFFLPGLITLLAWLGLTLWSLRRPGRHRLEVLFVTALAAAYFVFPGVNGVHRNFYSVRYFEPVALVLLSYAVWRAQAWGRRPLALGLVAMALAMPLSFFEGRNWETEGGIWDKSLRQTPANPTLHFQKLRWEDLQDTLGQRTPEQQKELQAEVHQLIEHCRQLSLTAGEGGTLCHFFWSSALGLPRKGIFAEMYTPELRDEARAFYDAQNLRLRRGHEERLAAGMDLKSGLVQKGRIDRDQLLRWRSYNTIYPQPFSRLLRLLADCADQGIDVGRVRMNQLQEDALIDAHILAELLSTLQDQGDRDWVRRCTGRFEQMEIANPPNKPTQ